MWFIDPFAIPFSQVCFYEPPSIHYFYLLGSQPIIDSYVKTTYKQSEFGAQIKTNLKYEEENYMKEREKKIKL